MNSRAINRKADKFYAAQRSTKRSRADGNGAYHDRAYDYNDFNVVHHREEGIVASGSGRTRHFETPRSPQKSNTAWAPRSTWMALDDEDFGLDPEGEWLDEGNGMEELRPQAKAGQPKKRSRVSVSKLRVLQATNLLIILIHSETTPCGMERDTSTAIPGRDDALGGSGRISNHAEMC